MFQGEGHEVASQRVTQTCMEVGNPGNGFIHFDNIGGALLALADNSYYDVLWRSIQSEPESVGLTYLYYFCVICFNSFLLLGIFVAVVTGTFSRVRQAYGDENSSLVIEFLPSPASSVMQGEWCVMSELT